MAVSVRSEDAQTIPGGSDDSGCRDIGIFPMITDEPGLL